MTGKDQTFTISHESDISELVGAVIVNFNAGSYLTSCVESLKAEGVQDIVVSDNGSTDDSLEELARNNSDVQVLRLPNPGYGGGVNQGAHHLDNKMLFIINPDARVKRGAIAALLRRLSADASIGIIGPRTENEDGSLYPSARRFPNFLDGSGHALLGLFFPNNRFSRRYKMLDWGHASFREVDWVSGAAMFVRREAFDQVGGFDDGFWMYLEDLDLCRRLHEHGWNIVYDPDASIVHVGGMSTSRSGRPFRFIKAHHESVLRYHRKNMKGLSRAAYPVIVVGMKLRLFIAWLKLRSAKYRV